MTSDDVIAGCAEYRKLDGVEVPWSYGNLAVEIAALRQSVAVSSLPHVTAVRVTGIAARDVLDRVIAGDLFLREGQVRQGLILNEDGSPMVDVCVCAEEDGYLVLGEGAPASAICALIRASGRPGETIEIEDLSASHTVLSLNGPFAWELLAEIEGPEVIGFPYLSFYKPKPDRVYVRAGKTGEYGYELLVPRGEAAALAAQLLDRGRIFDAEPAGMAALWQCSAENVFFNVHREGRLAGVTPIELQLQWRVSYRKEFVGRDALNARKHAATRSRLTALVADSEIAPGDLVLFGETAIGSVATSDRSVSLDRWIGAALLESRYAHSGVDRYVVRGAKGDVAVRTVSPPYVNNLSLAVSPQRHTYAERDEIVSMQRIRVE